MTYRKITVTEGLLDKHGDEIRQWVRDHGLDPEDVPSDADIEISGKTVTFEVYVRINGRRVFASTGNKLQRGVEAVTLRRPWPLDAGMSPEDVLVWPANDGESLILACPGDCLWHDGVPADYDITLGRLLAAARQHIADAHQETS